MSLIPFDLTTPSEISTSNQFSNSNDLSESFSNGKIQDSYVQTYWTGCQSHVFLNGSQYFGEAYGVSYSLNKNVLPVFGHRSSKFDRVAHGQSVVSGMILVNLSDFRYMSAAVGFATKTLKNQQEKAISTKGEFLLKQVPNLRGLTQQEVEMVYSQITSGVVPGTQDIAQEYISSSGLTYDETGLFDSAGQDLNINNIGSPAFHTKPFSLVMVIGNPNDISRPWYERSNTTMRRIVDVYITGESTEIMSNDNLILHAFPFIAKDVDFNTEAVKAYLSDNLKFTADAKSKLIEERIKEAVVNQTKLSVPILGIDKDTVSADTLNPELETTVETSLISRFAGLLRKWGVTPENRDSIKLKLPALITDELFLQDLLNFTNRESASGAFALSKMMESLDIESSYGSLLSNIESTPNTFSNFLYSGTDAYLEMSDDEIRAAQMFQRSNLLNLGKSSSSLIDDIQEEGTNMENIQTLAEEITETNIPTTGSYGESDSLKPENSGIPLGLESFASNIFNGEVVL